MSSDKSIKMWDLRTHRILRNWEFHQDSVHSIFVNDTFSRILTGSKNGEIFMTDLARSLFTKIDHVEEPITSLAMTKNLKIYAATSKNSLYEYVSYRLIYNEGFTEKAFQ